MAKKLKAQRGILIDPKTGKIEEVVYSGDFHDIYKLLDIETFEIQAADDKNDIYCDEEGLLKPIDCGFQFDENQPLAGKGLILGINKRTGNSASTTLTLEDVKKRVKLFAFGRDYKLAAMEWHWKM